MPRLLEKTFQEIPMTTTQAIRSTEQNMREAQAKGMIRTPKYAGRTYSDVKRERRERRMKVWQALGLFIVILTATVAGVRSCSW